MSNSVRLALAGVGAFGIKHLDGIKLIPDTAVVALVGRELAPTLAVAEKYNIPHATTNLAQVLAREDIDAVILCTPTPMHAAQAIQCLKAGKHVQIEIPVADNLRDVEAVLTAQREAGRIAMGGHTRRFNPSHQYMQQRIVAGDIHLQQLDVQTYFFRRENINALGEPRSWTDHLLWHHAAHTVDLFAYQSGGHVALANAVQGPISEALGIAMDMSIQLKSSSGALCTISLSFNNDGPLGSVFRYICDNGTFIARYDDLVNGNGEKIDLDGGAVVLTGIELQDREFIASIREGREPNASVAQLLPCYQTLHRLAQQLSAGEDVADGRARPTADMKPKPLNC